MLHQKYGRRLGFCGLLRHTVPGFSNPVPRSGWLAFTALVGIFGRKFFWKGKAGTSRCNRWGDIRCGIYHMPYFATEDGAMPILYVSMPKIEIIETK